jgi:hypothetical protein
MEAIGTGILIVLGFVLFGLVMYVSASTIVKLGEEEETED